MFKKRRFNIYTLKTLLQNLLDHFKLIKLFLIILKVLFNSFHSFSYFTRSFLTHLTLFDYFKGPF
jgi:hypothetical protein